MEITLDVEQAQLLAAVEQGRVHMDPRFTRPDFERSADEPAVCRRATQRLRPLKKALLVVLNDDAEPGQYGVRPYRLTALGERVLAEARTAMAAQRVDDPHEPDR